MAVPAVVWAGRSKAFGWLGEIEQSFPLKWLSAGSRTGFPTCPLSLSVRTRLLAHTSSYPVAAPRRRARGRRSPGTVALLLAEMERANAALPAGTQEVDLGQLGCIVGAVVDAVPGCLGLQDQVAGIITRTCARGAQRGEPAPGSVLEVGAATAAGWEVELAALGFQFGWRSGPTPPQQLQALSGCCQSLRFLPQPSGVGRTRSRGHSGRDKREGHWRGAVHERTLHVLRYLAPLASPLRPSTLSFAPLTRVQPPRHGRFPQLQEGSG